MKNRIAVFCDNRGLTRKAIFARSSVYLIAIVLFVIYVAFQAGSGEQWFKGLLNSTVAIILASVGEKVRSAVGEEETLQKEEVADE